MSSVRESIEWHYGETNQYFPFVDCKNKNFILQSPVRETYITALFFRNCLVCLHGNKTSTYFVLITHSFNPALNVCSGNFFVIKRSALIIHQ